MSALFSLKKHTSPRRLLQDRPLQGLTTKEPGPIYIRVLFDKEPRYMLASPSTKNQSNFKTRPSSSLFQIARGSGATPRWEYFFLQKGTHHSKIPRSTTWFHSRKHSGDACSCSVRPGGKRQGFRSSTMKCSGAYRCGTHGIHRKEERRSSLTRILPL